MATPGVWMKSKIAELSTAYSQLMSISLDFITLTSKQGYEFVHMASRIIPAYSLLLPQGD
jgi:hypothetical protein